MRNTRKFVKVVGILVALLVARQTAGVAQVPIGNGDVNGDGRIDISDAIYLISHKFSTGPAPVEIPCPPPPQLTDEGMLPGRASAQLSNQPGRAIVSARGNHFIVDSVPPLEGPNEEVNPLDLLLGALATCGIFVAEKVAQEEGIDLEGATASVEADFDPGGIRDGSSNPRIQVFRVHLDLPGADANEVEAVKREWSKRCPIYTTFIRSAPIHVTSGDEEVPAPIDGLATAALSAALSNQPGRAIVSARGNHFVNDSVPPFEGPNEERNPLDLLLGALATCGVFIYEKVALDAGLTLTDVQVNVYSELDPRGFRRGSEVSPHLQALRVNVKLQGVDDAQAAMLTEAYQQRCPIFTTLVRAVPIELTVRTDG